MEEEEAAALEIESTSDDANQNQNEKEKEKEENRPAKKKKRNNKEFAIYGNYRNYYGYRQVEGMFTFLKREWFQGKDCLDIGCNSGLITIKIAKEFCCRSILGIDIDSARINDARWNLEEETNQISEDSSDSVLFDKVSFKAENFVEHWCSPEASRYDTITCFSVTKWVHLNWGDDGLIKLFAKIWRLLRPGGILVLEPQPWASYYKKRQVSEIAKTNYKKLEIYPEDFQEILLDKIGFRMVDNITSGLSSTNRSATRNSGFNRPILALWK